MKFILNKDVLKVEDDEVRNSGSINYYEADVEYDESWNDLIIEAIIVKLGEDEGTSIAVINNKIYIDQRLYGTYQIGFVGYTLKEEQKVYQISSNLKIIRFDKGVGEIETQNQELPTPTEWEIYIAQIQEMLKNSGGSGGGLIDDVKVDGTSVVKNRVANIELRQTVIDILIEYRLIKLEDLTEEQIKALNEMVCEINEDGELIISYDEKILPISFELEGSDLILTSNINALFGINTNGELEVSYEGN